MDCLKITTIKIGMFEFDIRFFTGNLDVFNIMYLLQHNDYSKDENQLLFC